MYFFLVFITIFVNITFGVFIQKKTVVVDHFKQLESNKSDLKQNDSQKILIARLPDNIESNKLNGNQYLEKKMEVQHSDSINDTTTISREISESVNKLNASGTENGLLKIKETFDEKSEEVTSGAVVRGILVFMALSILFILYVAVKTYRRRRPDKRHTIVKKYGIRARHSDVEMEPLPLTDDDDDETLFDISANKQTKN